MQVTGTPPGQPGGLTHSVFHSPVIIPGVVQFQQDE